MKLLKLLKVTVLPLVGPVLNPDKMPEKLPLLPLSKALSILESKDMVISVAFTSAALAVNTTVEVAAVPLDQPTNFPENSTPSGVTNGSVSS